MTDFRTVLDKIYLKNINFYQNSNCDKKFLIFKKKSDTNQTFLNENEDFALKNFIIWLE